MSRNRAVVLAAILFAAGLASESIRQVWRQPLWLPLIDLAIGQTLVWCGLVAAVARPGQPAGTRLVLAGLLWVIGPPRQWFSGMGITDDFQQVDAISFTLVGWSDVVLALIALSFADRWPARRRDRWMVVALVATFSFQTVARLVARAPDLLGIDVPDATLGAVGLADIARLGTLAGAGILIASRFRSASPASRHVLGPVLVAGTVSCLVPLYGLWYPLSSFGLIGAIPESTSVPVFWATNAIRVVVPMAMLAGILRQRASRAGVAGAVASIGDGATLGELERQLGRALSDPTLRVVAWDAAASLYLDASGRTTPAPLVEPGGALTPVRAGDQLLGAVIHDRALLEDPVSLAAGVALTRLVLDNDRLARQLREQLAEIRASRARIVEAEDTERRRIERDLHDGVQQRLLALALSLRRSADGEAANGDARAALTRGAAEALAVVEDVRELAQGIHPAVLTEAGLAAALGSLAERSPIPVELDLDLDGRLRGGPAAAAYFVASEALANVAKHASASVVRIRATEGPTEVWVSIEDDGTGGANPGGHGLRGLGDRLAAFGGTLTVRDGPNGGTVVAATIPIR